MRGRDGGREGGREGEREGGREGKRGREELGEKRVCMDYSLLHFFFVLRFAFSIIHGSGRVVKNWGRPGKTYHVNDV